MSSIGRVDCGARQPAWGLALGGAIFGAALGATLAATSSIRIVRRLLVGGFLLLPVAGYVWFVVGFGYGEEATCWSSAGSAANDAWFLAYVFTLGVSALALIVRESQVGSLT